MFNKDVFTLNHNPNPFVRLVPSVTTTMNNPAISGSTTPHQSYFAGQPQQHSPAPEVRREDNVQNVSTLFSSGPRIPRAVEDIGPLIEVETPTRSGDIDTAITLFINEYETRAIKPNKFRVKSLDLPQWLVPIRKKFCDMFVEYLFSIQRNSKANTRLEEHLNNGTYPTEYSSIKAPTFQKNAGLDTEEFTSYYRNIILEAKKHILLKHVETTKHQLLTLKYCLSQPVVAEAFKSVASSEFFKVYAVDFTDWNSLSFILEDFNFLRRACSKVVNDRHKAELLKTQRLTTAQSRAAEEDNTLSIRDLVTKVVHQQVKVLKQLSKSTKPKVLKIDTKKHVQTKEKLNKKQVSSSSSVKKKRPAKKKISPKSNNKSPKESRLKASSSTSFHRKTGGKN